MKMKNPGKEGSLLAEDSSDSNDPIHVEDVDEVEEGSEGNDEEDHEDQDAPSSASSSDSSDSDSSMDSSSDDDDDGDKQGGDTNGNDNIGLVLDEEDPVIKAIEAAKEKKKADHPADIELETMPTAISFHPEKDLIVVSSYEGDVELYSYSDEENKKITSVKKKNNDAIRELTFTTDGEKLITGSSAQDVTLYDLKEGLKAERVLEQFTPAAISSLYSIDENTFATGDDDGYVMIWDKRSKQPAISLKIGDDAITSMISNEEKRILICASAEGAIYAIKIRGGGKVQTESEIYDPEFNCLGLFKQESKIAVGSGSGDVYVFNWNEFGKHSDIYTGIGKGEPINALIPITERIIVTGGDDGCIRAVNFFPQKFLGVVGKLPYPIDKMDVCNDGHLISSIGAEKCVKFWNVSYFEGMTVSTEDKMKLVKGKAKPMQNELDKANLPSSSHQNASDFYKGLE